MGGSAVRMEAMAIMSKENRFLNNLKYVLIPKLLGSSKKRELSSYLGASCTY